jgi:thioredoxin 2
MAQAAAGSRIVKCSSCGAQNRVAAETPTDKMPVCGRCGKALSTVTDKPVTVTDANFGEVVEKASLPVLLDLWAAWCGPCRMVAPIVEQIAAETAGLALVGKLDVDANPQTSARFGVQSIPTLLILKNGREVDRIVGAAPKNSILQTLQRHL